MVKAWVMHKNSPNPIPAAAGAPLGAAAVVLPNNDCGAGDDPKLNPPPAAGAAAPAAGAAPPRVGVFAAVGVPKENPAVGAAVLVADGVPKLKPEAGAGCAVEDAGVPKAMPKKK